MPSGVTIPQAEVGQYIEELEKLKTELVDVKKLNLDLKQLHLDEQKKMC